MYYKGNINGKMIKVIFQIFNRTNSIDNKSNCIITDDKSIRMIAKSIVDREAKKAGIEDVKYDLGKYGKPFVINHPEFKFNISHTKHAIAVAISDYEVGIDIEKIQNIKIGIIKRFFSIIEEEFIGNDNEKYTEIWCRREAYLKYLGCGLLNFTNELNILAIDEVYFNKVIIDGYCIIVCGKSKDIDLVKNSN